MTDLVQRLQDSYERIVYPTAMGDVPIVLEKMAQYDEGGMLVGYYSINALAAELGNLLVPTPFNASGTLMTIRWAFDKQTKAGEVSDEEATRALLKSYGLVDMMENKEASDIVIGDLVGNEFGLFGSYEFRQIPKEIFREEGV